MCVGKYAEYRSNLACRPLASSTLPTNPLRTVAPPFAERRPLLSRLSRKRSAQHFLKLPMAFLYSKSQTWRRIVNWTRESGGRLMMFGAVCVAVPVYLGSLVMDQTSGAGRNARLESELMDKANLDAKIGAKAQKNALAEMLRDVKEGKVDDRYNAAIVDGTIGSPRKSGLLVGKKAQEDAKKVSS